MPTPELVAWPGVGVPRGAQGSGTGQTFWLHSNRAVGRTVPGDGLRLSGPAAEREGSDGRTRLSTHSSSCSCSTDIFICTSPITMYKYCPYEKVRCAACWERAGASPLLCSAPGVMPRVPLSTARGRALDLGAAGAAGLFLGQGLLWRPSPAPVRNCRPVCMAPGEGGRSLGRETPSFQCSVISEGWEEERKCLWRGWRQPKFEYWGTGVYLHKTSSKNEVVEFCCVLTLSSLLKC